MTNLKTAAARFESWCREDALPLWCNVAGDPTGGFFEDLTMDGEPRDQQIRRVRVQPRQAYVYAHAHLLGWFDGAKAASDHGMDYMLEKAGAGDYKGGTFGGIAHRLHPDGTVSDPRRDTYDHAFLLLACAWRFEAFGCTNSRLLAAACLRFMDTHMGQEDGSFLEGEPASLPRRQNPHMHLFEAFMALARATGDKEYQDRARKIYMLFERHFFDAGASVIREYFKEDWSLDPDKSHLIEPGHMMEWVWLLHHYEQMTECDVSGIVNALYNQAVSLGTDGRSGFLWDCVSMDAEIAVPQTRRTWVQTEYIKAALVLAQRGDREKAQIAADLIDTLFSTYLNTEVPGGYIDQYGRQGQILSDAMPTSTLYHLISAAAEAKKTVEVLG